MRRREPQRSGFFGTLGRRPRSATRRSRRRPATATGCRPEQLENRRLLAFDLVAAYASSEQPFYAHGITGTSVQLSEAPQQITLRFTPGTVIDPTTLGGIGIVRAGGDGVFGNPNDVPLRLLEAIGYVGVDDMPNQNQIVIRFAESLPDDVYQIVVGADLRSIGGDSARRKTIDLRLDLGAHVTAVVPQPISRSGTGQLIQARNRIDVHFNVNDPLDQASAETAGFYRLIEVDADGVDSGGAVTPVFVNYSAVTGMASLFFASELPADRLYRLEIGGSSAEAARASLTEAGVNNSSFGGAQALGELSRAGISVTGAIARRPSVATPAGPLLQPSAFGSRDEPGHRDHPFIDSFQHGNQFATVDEASGMVVLAYNFQDVIGSDPQGNLLYNVITETQKQRAREIFELYSLYAGVQFVETANLGLTVATGDLRALDPFVTPNVAGLGGAGAAYMNSSINWGESEYGGSWFDVAMHEIGHALGLEHSYDLASIMGGPGRISRAPLENVFPQSHDITHLRQLYPIHGADIDVYTFTLPESGRVTLQTLVARPGVVANSLLDTVLTLYREDPFTGRRELIARNDDSFGRDSFLELDLASEASDRSDDDTRPYVYFVAVSSTGNTAFNPEVADSGFGGRTEGAYELQIDFTPESWLATTVVDVTGTPIDGDRDGTPGGLFRFWFQTAELPDTVFVDKANPASGAGNGSLEDPFTSIAAAITAAEADTSKRIIRIVGNTAGPAGSPLPYLIGTDFLGQPLPDGATFNVPAGVTVMIDAGAVFKLDSTIIDVGSSSELVSRAGAALQVLGTPGNNVIFTSYSDDAVGGDSDGQGGPAAPGQWGGIVLRHDSDQASKRAFVNSIGQATLLYGGGQVVVDAALRSFAPIQAESSRPAIVFNTVRHSAGAALAATPNSFLDTGDRLGPEIRGNVLIDNSVNGLFVKIDTQLGVPLERLDVPARWKSTDVVYVISENLVIDGGVGGYVFDGEDLFTRATGRLTIDPGVIVKLHGSRIELERGKGRLYAEGLPNQPVIFTSLHDNRFGAGGSFATGGDFTARPEPGDWGGIVLNAATAASIDHAYIGFGGGLTPIEGTFDNFNVIEVHQADLRLANSRVERNAAGLADSDRTARGTNAAATIFVRGAQPIIVSNDFRENGGAVVSINANSLTDIHRPDSGRATGFSRRVTAYDDNLGPLVRRNSFLGDMGSGSLLGMIVRGEEITVESVWDDIDIVHVLLSEIVVENFHSETGLRLLSRPDASLVVKLEGDTAGFTAAGYPLDIEYRIGGTVQIVGQPGYPVVLASLHDDSVGAGLDPLGRLVTDTNANGDSTLPRPADWRSLLFLPFSNDRNVAIITEAELPLTGGTDTNGRIAVAQPLGVLAPNFATGTNTWESAQEKEADEYRRLGFEVHGFIAPDDPTDVDIYSFLGYAGSEVWIDIDKTSSSLDAMVEVLNAAGVVIARSVDAQTDGLLSLVTGGAALPLEKDVWRGGDHYTLNPKDPGMRLILPGTVGQQNQYFVRVRSQPRYDADTTQAAFETAVSATNPLAPGATSGRYELRIRLRQLDEKPGSTVQFADIRHATIGIDVQGLPRNSLLLGEAGENQTDDNDDFATAQDVGHLLQSDRGTISIAGQIASAADVDWYSFALNFEQIQSIEGMNDTGFMWATVFDLDYGAGFRGDLTLAVFDQEGQLIYVGRDSNIEDDQPGLGQSGNDFDDLSRGSISPLDPFIGTVNLLAGGPTRGSPVNEVRYYVAVFSNERLPEVLNATFRSDSTNTLVRLEPITSIDRLVEDRIGSGELPIIDTTQLDLHVTPFTLADVTLFVTNGGGLFTFDAVSGVLATSISTAYAGLTLSDLDMRTDGRLFAYASVPANAATAGRLLELDTGTGGILFAGDDGIIDVVIDAEDDDVDNQQTTTNLVTALAFRRTGVGAYADLWYVVQDGGTSKLYRAENGGTAAGNPSANAFGEAGTNFGYRGRIVVDLDANGRYDGPGEQPLVTGLQFVDDVGGVLYGVTADGKLLAISPAASNPDLTNLGLVAVATVVADFSADLARVGATGFTALAAPPQNLYDGALRGRFFAMTNTGRLALINPAGSAAATDEGQFGLLERSGDIGGSIFVSGETVGQVLAQAATVGVVTVEATQAVTQTTGSYGGGITVTATAAPLERQTSASVSGTATSIALTSPATVAAPLVVAGTGTLTADLAVVTGIDSETISQLFQGMPVIGAGVAPGTRIASKTATTITLSEAATTSGTGVVLQFSAPRLFLETPGGVAVNMLAAGEGLAWGTTVLAVGDEEGQTWVALSAPPTTFSDGDDVEFYRFVRTVTRNVPAEGPDVTMTAAQIADLAEGMRVTGTGLNAETTITEIDLDNNRITLSNPVSAGSVTLSFFGLPRILGLGTSLTEGMVLIGDGIPTNTTVLAGGSLSKPVGQLGDFRAFAPVVTAQADVISGADVVTLPLSIRSQLAVGMPVVATGIRAGTTVTTITANGITLSQPAISNALATTLRFLPVGSLLTSPTRLQLTSLAGVAPDMLVDGDDVPWGTTVESLDPANRTIVVSQDVLLSAPSQTLRFYTPVSANGVGTATGSSVDLDDGTAGLAAGMVVTGGGLTETTRITSVVGDTVTLDREPTAGAVSLSFYGVTTVTGLAGIADGSLVTGPGVPAGTTVIVTGGVGSVSNPVGAFTSASLRAFGPVFTEQGTLANGSTTITGLPPAVVNELVTGMTVVGAGVPQGTTVTVAGGIVTLSRAATSDGSVELRFFDTNRSPRAIAVASTSGLTSGMLVVGPDIPWGTVIAPGGVGSSTVTVDRDLENPRSGVSLQFFSRSGPARTGTADGDSVTLDTGTAGLAVGMYVSGEGLASETRVTALDPATGVVTLDQSAGVGPVSLSFFGIQRVTVTSAAGLQNGMLVFGAGVPSGTRISSRSGLTLTLDQSVAPLSSASSDYVFIVPLNRPATSVAGSPELTVTNVAGLRVGMLVFGTGIAENTVVTEIAGTAITLSNPVTFTTTTTARFVQPDSSYQGDGTAGSPTVIIDGGFSSPANAAVRGLRQGMLVLGAGVPAGTFVQSISVDAASGEATLTLSLPVTASGVLDLRFVDGRTIRVADTLVTRELAPGMTVAPTPPVASGTTIESIDFAAGGNEIVVVLSAATTTTTTATNLVFGGAASASGNTDGRIVEVTLPTSFEGLANGLLVFGEGILDGTTVIASSAGASTITLSQPATRSVQANQLRLVIPDATRLYSTTAVLPLDQITVGTSAGLTVGMLVFAPDVPRNARITEINGTTVTLDIARQAPTDASGTARFVQPDLAVDAQPPGGNPAILSLAALTPAAFNAVHVGMLVFGEGLPANTTIVAVNRAARTITLSAAAPAGVQRYSFIRDGRVVGNVESLANIAVGDEVVGLGLAATDGLPEGTLVDRVATNAANINDYGTGTIVLTQSAYRAELGKRLVFTTPGAADSVVLGGLTSTAMLQPGMVVFADELESLAPVTIQTVDTLTSITLDTAVPLGTTPTTIVFISQASLDNPQVQDEATAEADSPILAMVTTAAIRIGMLVIGPGIPYNTVVTGKTATSLTLSKAATASGTDTYDFVNTSSVEYLADWNGPTTLFNFSPVLTAGATGLAFSPLDINLWHPSIRRESDPGHGINAAPDGTRGSSPGGVSLYFGLEDLDGSQYGGSDDWQQDLLANPAIGNNYNLPGGAYGSLTTNSFDLTNYVYTDKPTLYFNYWLQTENASGTPAQPQMRDSARVFLSVDGGLSWELVATNNPVRNIDTSELPLYPSVSSALSIDPRQAVQQLYGTAEWRQARIDLGTWAGQSDIRLRFDFSTAGMFDASRVNAAGEPLNQLLGTANETGDLNNPQRGQNNQFEGFYIDDIIVGFAERGEMVTAAPAGQTEFFGIGSPVADPFAQQILAGPYQLEIRRGTEYVFPDPVFGNIIVQTFDTNDRLVASEGTSALGQPLRGDSNSHREQGQFVIQGNVISDAAVYGISIDAGVRDPRTNAPLPGAPRNLPVLNDARLAPGAVVVNNVIVGSGTAGILFSGDPNTGNVPLAAVPFGRIVNNTIVGGADGQGVGVDVTQNAGPTVLNNVFAFLATGINVDPSSRFDAAGNQRTVVGGSAYFNTPDQVVGVAQSFPLVLAGNPFVNAAGRNFYPVHGSPVIDSAVNSLQDREEFRVVTSAIGVGAIPILAPDRDLYAQLRGDDPSRPSATGLGSNVFKDRGAIDRIDFAEPRMTLLEPLDQRRSGGPIDQDRATNAVRLEGADAIGVTRFVLQLIDPGTGIDPTTVVADAITVLRDGIELVEGRDFTFHYVPGSNHVVLEAASVYAFGDYSISVRKRAATEFQTGQFTDRANNPLARNKVDGSTTFRIVLVDAPGVPTLLTGQPGNGSVSLSWLAAPPPVSEPIIGYVVQRRRPGTGWATIRGVVLGTATTISSLTNGESYFFRVAAVTASGRGAFSVPTGPIVPGLVSLPGVPRDLIATAAASGTIGLGWAPPATTGGTGIIDYTIQYRVNAVGEEWQTVSRPANPTTTAAVTGFVNGQEYRFRVRAVNIEGPGEWSDEAIVLLQASPATPAQPLVASGDAQATVTWTPPDDGGSAITGYVIEYRLDGSEWGTVPTVNVPAPAVSYVLTGLSNGTAYRVRIAATNAIGTGSFSVQSVPVVPGGPAAAPGQLVGTAGDSQVALAWSAPTDTGGRPLSDYLIQVSLDGGQTWQLVTDLVTDATTAVVTGLANDQEHMFRVAAVTSIGTGRFSDPTDPLTPVAMPMGLTGSPGDSRVTLSWTPPSVPVTGYTVQYRLNVAGSPWVTFPTGGLTTPSAVVTGLVNGTSYRFRVAGVTAANGPTAFSAESAPVTPDAIASAPSNVLVSAGDQAVAVSWTAPAQTGGQAITNYRVEYREVGTTTWVPVDKPVSASTSAIARGLTNGRQYQFRVAAITTDLGEFSAPSVSVTPSGPAPTTAPGTVTGSGFGGAILINWQAVPRALEYIVEYRVDFGDSPWVRAPIVAGTMTSTTVNGLFNRSGYRVRVGVYGADGVIIWSQQSANIRPF